VDGGGDLQIWRVAANILNKQLWATDKGGPPTWGLGELPTTPCQNLFLYKSLNYTDYLECSCLKNTRIGTLNVKNSLVKENTFKPIIENDSLHEVSNNNGLRIVHFASSKNVTVKSMKVIYISTL
jgi:hypothetical protein